MNIFVGIGTGRCGTQSLARLTNACKNTLVLHDMLLVNWYNPSSERIQEIINFFTVGIAKNETRGLVSLNYLPILPTLWTQLPTLKIVHIYRDRYEVADSFCRAHANVSRVIKNDDLYQRGVMQAKKHFHNSATQDPLAGHPDAYPKFKGNYDCRTSYLKYWDYYRERVNELDLEDTFFHINVYQLNMDKKLIKLFNFLEIPVEDRVFLKKRQYHRID